MLLLEIIAIIAFLVVAFLKAKQEANKPKPILPYVAQARLLTPAEERFWRVLTDVTRTDYLLACKPRMADILKSQPYSHTAFNKISAKHFDFVLCDKNTTRPLLAIELDDASHAKASAQARDAVKDDACRAAQFPILRVPTQPGYDPAYLQKRIAEMIFPTPLDSHANPQV